MSVITKNYCHIDIFLISVDLTIEESELLQKYREGKGKKT
jgi:hypothetical protein